MTRFDWSAFLALAEELAVRDADEAAARTAVSRAYYAAFHRTRQAMLRAGVVVRRHGSDHGLVVDWLAIADESCAVKLRRLRQLRNAADYDATWAENLAEEARQALDLARGVIACTESGPE